MQPQARHYEAFDVASQEIWPDDPEMKSWQEGFLRLHRDRLALDLALVERHACSGPRILDVGCIPLVLTRALASQGHNVCGIDLRPEAYATAIGRLGLDVRRVDIEEDDLNAIGTGYDLVICNEVFEHLHKNPIRAMRALWHALRPGGLLMLSTPNLYSFAGIRNFLVKRRAYAVDAGGLYAAYEKAVVLGYTGHVREYTAREVSEFLTACGFRVGEVLPRGGHSSLYRALPAAQPFVSVFAHRPS